MEEQVYLRAVSSTDIVPIARIHRKAFPHSALSYLGVGALSRYYDWLLNGPHKQLCEAVFVGDVLAGFCFSGKFKGAVSGFLKRNKVYLALVLMMKPYLLFHKEFRKKLNVANRVFGRMRRDKEFSNRGLQLPHYGILAIAVDPDVQGKGVGRLLMDSAERMARTQEYTLMLLTVETDNEQAVRFYEKLGWTKKISDGKWEGKMTKNLEQEGEVPFNAGMNKKDID